LVMEADAAHGAIVFVEPFNQRAHAVIPQLDYTVVETAKKKTNVHYFVTEWCQKVSE